MGTVKSPLAKICTLGYTKEYILDGKGNFDIRGIFREPVAGENRWSDDILPLPGQMFYRKHLHIRVKAQGSYPLSYANEVAIYFYCNKGGNAEHSVPYSKGRSVPRFLLISKEC